MFLKLRRDPRCDLLGGSGGYFSISTTTPVRVRFRVLITLLTTYLLSPLPLQVEYTYWSKKPNFSTFGALYEVVFFRKFGTCKPWGFGEVVE